MLFVLAYHAGLPLPGGFTGVDIFFVISGFVITLVILREWKRHGAVSLATFYVRRFHRLIPALALVLCATVALSPLLLSPLGAQSSTVATALGAILLLANVVIARTTGDYFDVPAESNALLHTWSLSVEEQFYLVFPILVLLALKNSRRWAATPVAVVIFTGVVSFTLVLVGSRNGALPLPESFVGFYGPATRVWEFAVGSLLALLSVRASRWAKGTFWQWMGLLLLMGSGCLISSATPFPSEWTLLPVLGTGLIISSAPAGGPVGRLLAARPMQWIGDRSYSIYLWHWPMIVFAGALFPGSPWAKVDAGAASVLPAAASYAWVEEPLRRGSHVGFAPVARLAAVTVVPVILISGLVWLGLSQDYGSSRIALLRASAADVTRGCHGYTALKAGGDEECSWNRQAGGRPIYLLGDAHAKHLSEGLIAAGAALSRPVVISTASNCPMVDVYVRLSADEGSQRDCRSYVEGTLNYLDESPAGTVLLSASDLYWRDSETSVGLVPEVLISDPERKLALARTAWSRTVDRIARAGHTIVVVQDVPRWSDENFWDPSQCTGIELLVADEPCRRTMSAHDAEARQGSVRAVLGDVAEQPIVDALADPWPILCPEGWCVTARSGQLIYRDSNHISNSMSAALEPWFEDLLQGIPPTKGG